MKSIHILSIFLLGFILIGCSNKQTPIKKEIKKTVKIQKKIDNYKKAMSYEDKNGVIKGNNYAKYKYYLDKAIKEKNPKAYVKAFNNYKNPIGKKAYIKKRYKIVSEPNRQKATKFAILAIENKKDKKIACSTIKQIGNQYIFDAKESYKIYLANKKQGCINKIDKKFDFQFTPSVSFINKTNGKKEFKEKNKKVQKELIDNYAKKAINETLGKDYVKYDDRWIILSQSAINLAKIEYSEGNEESAGYYLALAKDIIESTPLNKNRYYRYDLKNGGEKKYYHYKQRNKIIKIGSDKILKTLLKII